MKRSDSFCCFRAELPQLSEMISSKSARMRGAFLQWIRLEKTAAWPESGYSETDAGKPEAAEG